MHGGAGLPVVEVHPGEDLLAEVLHEPVGAEVERLAHLALPVADGGRVGEVEQGDLLAGGPGGQVGLPSACGRDPAVGTAAESGVIQGRR